jgi:hypothetical protein
MVGLRAGAGLDPAGQPEASLLQVLGRLELDPGRAEHGPVALAGRLHGEGGQLLGERPLVVREALAVARRQLVDVDVRHVHPVHAHRAPVLDLPDQPLAQLDGLHPGTEGAGEQPLHRALEPPLEIPQDPHRSSLGTPLCSPASSAVYPL